MVVVSARAALLQALTLPGHGLELIERVRRGSGGRVRLGMGSVYPALHELEREGLVRLRGVETGPAVARRPRSMRKARIHFGRSGKKGRPRRRYELTVRGVLTATAEREALLGLLGAEAAASVVVSPETMRERLESCSELSRAVLTLQRRMEKAARIG